jgi:hypothetical protein
LQIGEYFGLNRDELSLAQLAVEEKVNSFLDDGTSAHTE